MPRRGETWTANLGDPPTRHWVLIVSLDARNASDRVDSVLIVPFGSSSIEGPTSIRPESGETDLPGPSYLKPHFVSTLTKSRLLRSQPRPLSSARMREVVTLIRKAVDPEAPYERRDKA